MHAYYLEDSVRNQNKIQKQFTQFSNDEITKLDDGASRMKLIFENAKEKHVSVLVDAEQTYVQPAIDSFAVQFGNIYNKDATIVLNTFQNYLRSGTDRIRFEFARVNHLGLNFGGKFVRGAYMIEERRLAKELKYPDPIHDTVQDTHKNYNSNVAYAIPLLSKKSHLMVASHNEESVISARDLSHKHEKTAQVSFAQLLGLADHLTFSLAKEGLPVSKYVPFGPLDTMIPYLIRRAQESRQMLSSANLQRNLVLNELVKRVKS